MDLSISRNRFDETSKTSHPNSRRNFQNYLPLLLFSPLTLHRDSPKHERYSQFLLASSQSFLFLRLSSTFFSRANDKHSFEDSKEAKRREAAVAVGRAGQNVGRDKSSDGAKGPRWPLDSPFPGHLARYTTVTSHVHSEKRRLTRVLLSARSLYQSRLLRGRSLPRQIYES